MTPSNDRLRQGLRIGNFVFRPDTGEITGAQGSHSISIDRSKLLLLLARRQGELVALKDLAEEIGLDAEADRVILDRHIAAIKESLGDTGLNPRFVVVAEGGITLIAPVTEGTGSYSPESDDGDEEDLSFLNQLQRRKVIRVAAGYVVLSWIAIQVADTVVPAIGLPEWTITLTIAIAMIGFPVAVVIAWLYEVTPAGLLRDDRRTPVSLTGRQKAIDIVVLASLAIVVGYLSIGVFSDVQRARDTALVNVGANVVMAARNTIAVLPFRYTGANQDNAYIGDGLAEEILRLLSRIKELRVTARTASFYFKDKPNVDMETIANKLQVRHLLSGSVQIAGTSIRINAELVDAASGQQLWSESFDRQMIDIFDIQSEIAQAVVKESEQRLSADSVDALSVRPTESLEAYDYYLRGRDYMRQPVVREVVENAQKLFHRALALDPDYALALAGLCETHLAIYTLTKSTATVDDAESDCGAALESNSKLPEVHTALGGLYLQTGQFDQSEQEFRKAIDINPNFFEAFSGLGDVLLAKNDTVGAESAYVHLTQLQPAYWRGYQKLGGLYYQLGDDLKALPNFQQVTELTPDNAPGWNNLGSVQYMLGNLESAAKAWRKAIDIRPHPSSFLNLGTMYYYLRRYEESVEMHRNGLELTPEDYRMWGRMAAAYREMGNKKAEAIAAYSRGIQSAEKILAINPNESVVLKNIGLFYAHIGDATAAIDAIERALALAPQDPDTHFFAALTYLSLGDTDRSMQALEEAVALGYSVNLLVNEPALDEIRQTERLKVLLQESRATKS